MCFKFTTPAVTEQAVASFSHHTWSSARVVCSEIRWNIYSNLSGSLLNTYVNQLFSSPTLQSDAEKSEFLINNSPDLYALTVCITFRKITFF